ncbi:EsaB/YukD family protein [Micrococcus porci]|uniref:EsaB/YukD family protein n=1 Tax=Micrococcus porci TaxID=2856555 RepID=UPI001CCEC633|nr:EsaB/YukD family protein [Micrococcus porci]UBH24940.1 EsaB/YukD family protein [Micrococcus porci]
MATKYSRVTLLGERRHADVLLPSDTPVGVLMPQILSLLAEQPGREPAVRALYRDTGAQLAPETTLGLAGVLDGETLRVAATTTAPDAPIVYDLHDTVAAQTDARGRWGKRARLTVLGLVAVFLGWWAAVQLTVGLPDEASALARLGIGAGLLLASLGVSVWSRRRAVALTLLGAGAVIALNGHWWLMAVRAMPLAPAVLIGLCGGVALLLLAAQVSGQRRPLVLAAGVLAVLTGAWAAGPTAAGWLIGERTASVPVTVGALTAVVALLVLSVLAQAAVSHAGLAGLDDQESAGARLLRTDVAAAVATAHRSMVLGVLLCAASIAVSFWWISDDIVQPAFSVPFSAVLTIAVWLRAQAFPLTLQRAPLLLTAAWGLWCTVRLTSTAFPALAVPLLVALAVIAVLLVALQVVTVPPHVQARARRLSTTLETLAVVALIPLLVGYVGLYAAMLETF